MPTAYKCVPGTLDERGQLYVNPLTRLAQLSQGTIERYKTLLPPLRRIRRLLRLPSGSAAAT